MPGMPRAKRIEVEALIIAAGFGSRLRGVAPSKPLARVAGMPLVEIAIRQLAGAGARRIHVVTGYRAAEIEALLPGIAAHLGIAVEPFRLDDWSRPNGYSVMAGAARIEGDYLLAMADHLFEASILDRLTGAGAPDRGVTLAIDRRIDSPWVDPQDATWVMTGGSNRIIAIGKALTSFDAVDCGAFLATGELAPAIAAAITNGRPGSLSDGMQVLADRGRAAVVDVEDAWWLDVDDPATWTMAQEEAPARLADLFACTAKRG